jgi:hypothetical protein
MIHAAQMKHAMKHQDAQLVEQRMFMLPGLDVRALDRNRQFAQFPAFFRCNTSVG